MLSPCFSLDSCTICTIHLDARARERERLYKSTTRFLTGAPWSPDLLFLKCRDTGLVCFWFLLKAFHDSVLASNKSVMASLQSRRVMVTCRATRWASQISWRLGVLCNHRKTWEHWQVKVFSAPRPTCNAFSHYCILLGANRRRIRRVKEPRYRQVFNYFFYLRRGEGGWLVLRQINCSGLV